MLDEVENEMKRIGYWRSHSDGTFESYLQFEFLPSARQMCDERKLPNGTSMLGVMAMRNYDYMDSIEAAHPLMHLLYRFDNEVNSINGIKG